MSTRRHLATICATLVLAVSLASPAFTQDPLTEARELYGDAMYAQALERLDRLARAGASAEAHQYRALCLLALGQREAAERAMGDVVAADPFFRPDSRVAAPRVLEMFAAARRQVLPPAIRRIFAEATALHRDGARERARERFDQVRRLLDDPALHGDQGMADFALLASAFVELARAQEPPAPAAPPPIPATSTYVGVLLRPVADSAVEASSPNASAVDPAVGEVGRGTSQTSDDPAFEPPVALDQTLPQWTPPNALAAGQVFDGAIQVTVDENGNVVATKRVKSSHPSYDVQLLNAARRWRYKPALRNGQPVSAEVVVEVRLKPV